MDRDCRGHAQTVLAHMTQLLTEVPMSTRKVAMCALHVSGDRLEAMHRGAVPQCAALSVVQSLGGIGYPWKLLIW